MSEAAVKNALKAYLKSIGAYWFMPVQMGYGAASVDFLVCWRGRFYGIETKRPGIGKVSLRQQVVLDAIVKAGGVVIVENSTGLEATRQVLFKSEMWDDPVVWKIK